MAVPFLLPVAVQVQTHPLSRVGARFHASDDPATTACPQSKAAPRSRRRCSVPAQTHAAKAMTGGGNRARISDSHFFPEGIHRRNTHRSAGRSDEVAGTIAKFRNIG